MIVAELISSEHPRLSVLSDGKHSFQDDRVPFSLPSFATYDMRKTWPISDSAVSYDVKLLYGSDESLPKMAKRFLKDDRGLEILDRRFKASVRTAKATRIPPDLFPIWRLVSPELVGEYYRARAMVIHDLYEQWSQNQAEKSEYESGRMPLERAVRAMELAGIAVDKDLVEKLMKRNCPGGEPVSPHVMKFLRSVHENSDSGYVRTKIHTRRGRTWRMGVEGGFQCMSVPHGEARQTMVSRFKDGKIVSFDFNAIDFRCIVQSVEDQDFRRLYDGCDDFHSRTAELIFGKSEDLVRKALKAVTYVSLYGGSSETVSRRIGLSLTKTQKLVDKANELFEPVRLLRVRMFEEAKARGYIELPSGHRMPLEADDHPGAALGIYAQGFSSYVFEKALVAAHELSRNWASRIIFTVHDEMNMDFCPDELGRIDAIKDTLENAVPGYNFKVKAKAGNNYDEATE